MYVRAYAYLSVFVSTWNQWSIQGAVQQPLFTAQRTVQNYGNVTLHPSLSTCSAVCCTANAPTYIACIWRVFMYCTSWKTCPALIN